jgi:two-component system sensor histidine kinase BaeS
VQIPRKQYGEIEETCECGFFGAVAGVMWAPPDQRIDAHVRLWLRLFLAFAALSTLALLGFAAWQQLRFRSGFLSYLDEVAAQRIEPARARLVAAYATHGSWDFLRDDPEQLGELMEIGPGAWRTRGGAALEPSPDNTPPWPAPRDRPPGTAGFDRERPAPEHEAGDRDEHWRREHDLNGAPPRPFGPPDLMPRLQLVDAAGAPVVGRALPADALALPLALDGKPIGTLRLARLTRINAALDLSFAQAQSRDALLVGVTTLIAALALAFALARWLLAPVRELAAATRALAGGDFARRVTTVRSDELGALAGDFNRLAATLEQNREARRQWGTDLAHELRTPLAILRGEIEALQDGVRAPTQPALDSLQAECERLGALIEDLYQLSLADAGALDYRFEALDLAVLLHEVLAAQQPAFDAAGLTLEPTLGLVQPVRGDTRRLAQLVDNLLVNARRYTDAPGRVRVELAAIDRAALLTVDDTPPGVPTAALPYLFERLYRVDESRSRAAGGAGLGLSICRAIVDAHGGTITAQSSPLGGLRIVVALPFSGVAPA